MAKLSIGDRAVDFNLPGSDGKNYSLDSFRDGKALAVIFSCVHCPYVLAWEDRMIELQNEFADKGAKFVLICANDAVNYPQDSFDNMKIHAEEKNYPFPFVHDESQEVSRAYGAERTPEVFLFDSERKLVFHGAVDDNYEDPGAVTETWLRDALEAVTSGNTPAKQSVPARGCTIKWK
ncbi:MAG: thioredoxin family protein [Candidatus Glassbacteria bacterium]|nr:thioredoxin family protein [Candidatus Glassbacteria bacterium]